MSASANQPRMFYFGPWNQAGHFMHAEDGRTYHLDRTGLPWDEDDGERGIDCQLQPGCVKDKNGYWSKTGPQIEGQALIHHKAGWTALSFWDRSVDKRGGCNSTYLAEGVFTFAEMVEMAKTRFAYRWNKMNFPVVEAKEITQIP